MSAPIAPYIRSLFSFCDHPLTYDSVRKRAAELCWTVEEEPDNQVLRVSFSHAVSDFVASLAPGQEFGRTIYLPLYTTDDPYDCITGASATERPDFVQAYRLALSLFVEYLGEPADTGTFEFFKSTYEYAAWRGSHAALVLLQDDFDIQFGSEITVWIIECATNDPLPTLPPHT